MLSANSRPSSIRLVVKKIANSSPPYRAIDALFTSFSSSVATNFEYAIANRVPVMIVNLFKVI